MTNHPTVVFAMIGGGSVYGDNYISIVNGQDYAGGVSAYDDDIFINHVLSLQD
jgi:hypothetical protein